MIYDEQLRMPLSISWPARFASQRRAHAGAGRGGRHRPDLPRARGRRRPGRRATRGCAAGRSCPRVEDPAGATGKDFTVSTCDEVWSPQDFAGVGQAVEAPRARGAVGPLQGRPLRRDVRQAAEASITDDQEYELYDLAEDPYELRNLARDPAYKPLLDDMLARLRELENERLGPVEVPALRRRVADRAAAPRPDRPARDAARRAASRRRRRSRACPAPTSSCPFGDPHLERRVYESGGGERLPQTADESRAMAEARARQRARDALRARAAPPASEEAPMSVARRAAASSAGARRRRAPLPAVARGADGAAPRRAAAGQAADRAPRPRDRGRARRGGRSSSRTTAAARSRSSRGAARRGSSTSAASRVEVAISPDGRVAAVTTGVLGRARPRDRRPARRRRAHARRRRARRRSASRSRPRGKRLVVSGGEQEGTVHVLDTDAASAVVAAGADRRSSRAASRSRPATARAWIALNGDDAVVRVDLRDRPGRAHAPHARAARPRRAVARRPRACSSPTAAATPSTSARSRSRTRQRAPPPRRARCRARVAWTARGAAWSRSAAPARSSCSAPARRSADAGRRRAARPRGRGRGAPGPSTR